MAENNPRNDAATNAVARELVIARVFDAPRSLAFSAWTSPNHVAQWWGPHGFTNPVCELDARPGGAIRIHMCGPDGIQPALGVRTGQPRQLGPKSLSDLRTSQPHRNYGARVAAPVIASVEEALQIEGNDSRRARPIGTNG
jgi:hypothetical protein